MALTFEPARKTAWPPADQGRGPYVVKPNESFESIARREGIEPWTLISFNFQTTRPDEVNWYLANVLKCTRQTHDRKNYVFGGGETIYLPRLSTPQCSAGSWAGVFRRTWDWAEVGKYQQWARANAANHVDQPSYRRDCADFSISLLLEYAETWGLPVAFHNGPSQHWRGWNNVPEGEVCADTREDGSISVAGLTFKHYRVNYRSLEAEANQRLTALHLQNTAWGNTVAIAFGQLQPGDLLVRGLPNTPHVQVVLEPHSNIQANVSSWGRTGRTTQLTPRSVLEIVQGNEPDPAKATLRERWNVAVPIKHKAWDLAPGDGPSGAVYLYYEYVRGEWQEATPDTPLRTFEARRWNFAAFNHAYGLKP